MYFLLRHRSIWQKLSPWYRYQENYTPHIQSLYWLYQLEMLFVFHLKYQDRSIVDHQNPPKSKKSIKQYMTLYILSNMNRAWLSYLNAFPVNLSYLASIFSAQVSLCFDRRTSSTLLISNFLEAILDVTTCVRNYC